MRFRLAAYCAAQTLPMRSAANDPTEDAAVHCTGDRSSAPSLWPETDWDKVLALRDPAAHAQALAEICETYRGVFLRVLRRWDAANAEDMAQDFILGLIQHERLRRVDPALGRFRQYVGRMLMNFARKQHLRAQALKRGAGVDHLELADDSATVAAPEAEVFDHEWARMLLGRVIKAFKNECTKPEILRLALRELVCGEEAEGDAGYVEISARTGVPQATLRSEVTRMRARFYERLKQEVALTTVRSELDEEMRHLLRALVASGGGGAG